MLAYRDGAGSAFDELYRRHKGPLYRFLLRQCRDAAAAEELFQDVWMNLIRARASYTVAARFTTYLYRLAHNRLIDHYRRRAPGALVSYDDEDEKLEMPALRQSEPHVAYEARQKASRLLELLAALPESQREAFVLQHEGGLSIEEIAEATGVASETAKSRLRYAMSQTAPGARRMAVNEHDKADESPDARIARLYRDLAREEPPPRLDRAITRAARQPARTPASSARSSWWGSWRLPFAVAAVGVVSVSLVTLMLEEGGERLTQAPQAPPAAVEQQEAVPAEAQASGAGAADARVQRREENRSGPSREIREQALRAEPPAPSQEIAAAKQPDAAVAERQSQAAETAAPGPARGSKSDIGAARSQAAGEPVAAPPPDLAAPAPMAAPEAQDPSAGPRRRAAPAAKPAPAPAARASPPMRKPEREAAAAPPPDAIATEIAALEDEPPAAWVERMLALRRAGRVAEADALAAEFRKRFPAVPLPAEVR